MTKYRQSTSDRGMAVLETALCLIVFVFIVLATAALFFFLFNRQIIEHAVFANAAKVRTVPYRVITRDGDVSYELGEKDLIQSIQGAATSLMKALGDELIGADSNSLTVQVGYLQLTPTPGSFSVLRSGSTTRGNQGYARSLADVGAARLTSSIAGIDSSDSSGPAPVLLRVRVHLLTEAFTRFDLLRVTPDAIEFDVLIPLRQQAGLFADAYQTGTYEQRMVS